MDEMQAFYDAAFPRLADALTYLDEFDLRDILRSGAGDPVAGYFFLQKRKNDF